MTHAAPAPDRVIYRPLGWWRFALAFSVAYGHASWILDDGPLKTFAYGFPPGSSAVFTFFLLSGFILSEAMAWFYADRPQAFVKNRALKILPTFFVALAVSMAVHAAAAQAGLLERAVAFEGRGAPPETLFGPANFVLNLLSWLPSAIGSLARKALDVDERYVFVRYVWAVRVEVVFYILLALAILIGKRKPEMRRYGLAAIWAATALAALNQIAEFSGDFAYAPYFVMGVSLFWQTRDPRFRLPGLAAVPLAAIHAYGALDHSILSVLGLMALLVVSAGLCLSTARSERFRRIDRMLGDVSYSLYLNQFAVFVAWSAFLPEARGTLAWILAVLASLGVAALIHVLVERPLVGLRRRIRQASIERQSRGGAAAVPPGGQGGI